VAMGSGPDGEPRWVYYPLLRELLRQQVAPGLPDGRLVAAAHARAARSYAARDDAIPALQHAVASADSRLIVDLLVRLTPRLLAAGHVAAVARALDAVPPSLRATSRPLVVVSALERRAAGDVEGVLHCLAALGPADGAEPDPAVDGVLDAMTRADELSLRLWSRRTGIGPTSGSGEEESPETEWSRAEFGAHLDVVRLAGWDNDLAYATLWAGDVGGAVVHARRAAVLGRAAGSGRIVSAAESVIAVAEFVAARPQTAALVAHRALEQWPAVGGGADGAPDDVRLPEEACLRAVLGLAAWCSADRGEARRQLELARSALDPAADPMGAALTRLLAARVLADEGDVALARRVIGGDHDLPHGPPFLRAVLEILRGELALAMDDVAAVQAHADAARALGWVDEALLLSCALAVRTGDLVAVPRLITPVLRHAEQAGPRADARAAEAAVYDLVLTVSGMPESIVVLRGGPRERLRDVLSRCATERRVRTLLVGAGTPAFLDLIRDEAAAEDGHPFAAEALAALAGVPGVDPQGRHLHAVEASGRAAVPARGTHRPGTSTARPQAGWAPVAGRVARPRALVAPLDAGRPATPVHGPVPPLTAREVDVLRGLANGESYLDIAHDLYITQNTVKTHVASLYRKLNAGRRPEALRTARRLGLLTDTTTTSPLTEDGRV
jgi:LuxR family transcriptional regulator, maltose regulon positive regulatory protein